jgi:hypothetical protein
MVSYSEVLNRIFPNVVVNKPWKWPRNICHVWNHRTDRFPPNVNSERQAQRRIWNLSSSLVKLKTKFRNL